MNRRLALTTLFALAALLSGCMGGGSQVTDSFFQVGQTYRTQTNLHADPRGQLYTVNYQQALLIPVGSEIRVDSLTTKRMTFTLLDGGRQFEYDRDRNTLESLESNLKRYFGTEDVTGDVARMSQVDQDGIRMGQPMVGMTKEGVRIACGDPPDHGTPSLDSPAWTYWKNRWVTRIVQFDRDGIVTMVQG